LKNFLKKFLKIICIVKVSFLLLHTDSGNALRIVTGAGLTEGLAIRKKGQTAGLVLGWPEGFAFIYKI
jgi:hypothetical protein